MPERAYEWSEIPHLAQRTLWSLRRPAPDPEGETWLLGLFSPAEALLYRAMDDVDRAHAIGCAQFVRDQSTEVIVASALHDVGKTGAGLGTPGRVAATLCGLAIAERARGWAQASGLRRQIAAYLDHAELGAQALEQASASQLAIDWARQHHLDPSQQTIAPDLAALLHAADES